MDKQPYKWMTFQDEKIILTIKAVPNSSKNMIIDEGEFLKIKITAPAVDNKANTFLVEYIAKLLKVPKTSIEIKSGMTSKLKRIMLPKNICIEDVTKLVE